MPTKSPPHLFLQGKNVVITGGTGSLGQTLLRRILTGRHGTPKKILIFSRDEARQHDLRLRYMKAKSPTEEIIYENFRKTLQFQIGDVRNMDSLQIALRNADLVFHAAAMKQVPTCEYFPFEAVQTNVFGAQNIVRAIQTLRLPVRKVIGISTDKAVKPVNTMGMTKAIMEKIFSRANLESGGTVFVNARYGNVLASRGSVVPLFREQIRRGGPLTITDSAMTRFLLSLEDAVDVILDAAREGRAGETWIPVVPSAKVTEIAKVMIAGRKIPIRVTGIRPGEKLHEILVSEEECHRARRRGKRIVIDPLLPELRKQSPGNLRNTEYLSTEYSSADHLLSSGALAKLLSSIGESHSF